MIYEMYDPEKTYVTPDGNYITPEQFAIEHNVVFDRRIAVGLMGRTIMDVQDLGYMRALYGITSEIPDDEAFAIINMQVEIDKTESSPMERIAAALEYIELYLMDRSNNEL